ncbi:MAG: formylglycine-generating enzyme family protein, partial [Kiloniellales bacterium]
MKCRSVVAAFVLALVALAQSAAAEELRKTLSTFKDCELCPEMVVIPAGSFMMGSPADEPIRGKNEGPPRQVNIANPFAVGKFEVTFDEWDACVAADGCDDDRLGDRGWGRGRSPVILISWDDAKAYVDWLSENTGQPYRLPSEAEWEYVARAGTTTPFSTGQVITTDQANFNGTYTYNGSSKGAYRKKTTIVGSFPANAFGLHDVHGNVVEWVADCTNDNYHAAPV